MTEERGNPQESSDLPDATPATEPDSGSSAASSSTVLELFGVQLKVRNERLADVLKMDAKDALGTDVKDLADGRAARAQAAEAAEAIPDVVLTPGTAREGLEAQERAEMRQRVSALGTALGFDVQPNGVWASPSGVGLLTRVVDRTLSPAAAVDLVVKVDEVRPGLLGPISSALFVAEDPRSAGVVSSAISERELYDHARAIALEDLEFIQTLHVAQTLDHRGVLVLLTPVADADVGDLLKIIRDAAG